MNDEGRSASTPARDVTSGSLEGSYTSHHASRSTRGAQRLLQGRRRYELWSPQSLEQVSAALSAELGAEQITPFENISAIASPGNRERSLVIAGRDAGASPWRFVFKGSMIAQAGGTCLTGEVGPGPVFLIAVLVWMSVVSLFLLSGIVTVVVGLMSGQRTLVIPWVVVPTAVLLASYALHRTATISAHARWRSTDQWLRQLLDARETA